MSGPSISAAAVARIIRDNDVSFRSGYDDGARRGVSRRRFADADRQLAYDLGWEIQRSGRLADRLADQAADEKARMMADAADEYERALAA
jgi:hypothetical protein